MSDSSGLSEERVAYLDGLVNQARTAAAAFSQYTQEDVDRIVKPMVIAGLEAAQDLARLAIEETKIGVLEDKAIKNMVATEFVYNYVKDKRTVGVIRGTRHARTRGAHRRHPVAYADYKSYIDRALQVHHGDQDPQRSDLQPASGGVALLRRGGPRHVRDSGEARSAGRRLYLS